MALDDLFTVTESQLAFLRQAIGKAHENPNKQKVINADTVPRIQRFKDEFVSGDSLILLDDYHTIEIYAMTRAHRSGMASNAVSSDEIPETLCDEFFTWAVAQRIPLHQAMALYVAMMNLEDM